MIKAFKTKVDVGCESFSCFKKAYVGIGDERFPGRCLFLCKDCYEELRRNITLMTDPPVSEDVFKDMVLTMKSDLRLTKDGLVETAKKYDVHVDTSMGKNELFNVLIGL